MPKRTAAAAYPRLGDERRRQLISLIRGVLSDGADVKPDRTRMPLAALPDPAGKRHRSIQAIDHQRPQVCTAFKHERAMHGRCL